MEFNDRTKLAIQLAKQAGMEIERIAGDGSFHTQEKGLKDVLTIADTTSEEIIVGGIRKSFPEDNIIAEENGNYKVGNNEFSWVIDPLDGTMNFSRKIPFYCVSVGYMKNGIPEGGAVFIPKTNEIFVCERGKGAFCNGHRLSVSQVTIMDKSLATIGFNNRFPEMTAWHNDIHSKGMNHMQNIEKLFSSVISLCYVAAGKTEAHMEIYCYLWDICVGSLMVEEAGGKATAPLGKEIDFSLIEKQNIIASNRKIHDEFVKLVGDNE